MADKSLFLTKHLAVFSSKIPDSKTPHKYGNQMGI